jgi:hypothetical protein
MKRNPLLLCCVLALASCGDREAEQRAAAQAQVAAQEEAADELAREYDRAVTGQSWDIARVHGSALLSQYPESRAAARIKAAFEEVKAKGEAAREQRRLAALWNYAQVAAPGGTQKSAMIYSKDPVDLDGSGARPVQLVFRDHPKWKRSAYLVLQASDFRCSGGCTVKVVADGAAAKSMAAWRPDTDEAIAMFITDFKGLWRLAGKTKTLSIEFPVKGGGRRTATFETGGLDSAQMPGWN